MKIKNLIVFLIAASFFMTLFFIQNVSAVTGDIKLASGGITETSFDGVAAGTDSYTGADSLYAYWKNMGTGDHFETSHTQFKSTPNSLLVMATGTAGNGYLNLTSSYAYLGTISFYVYTSIGTGGDLYMQFFNGTTEIIRLHWDVDEKLDWTGVTSGSNAIYDMLGTTWYQVVIIHNTTNYFNISVYSDAGVLLAGKEVDGYSATNYKTFSHIYFFTDLAGQSTYFDDFVINENVGINYSGGYGSIDGYGSICSGGITEYTQPYWLTYTYEWWDFNHMWGTSTKNYPQYIETQFPYTFTGKIGAVDLSISNDQYNLVSSATTAYYMYANGFPCGYPDYILEDNGNYILRWIITPELDYSNEKPFFAFSCNQYVTYSGNNYYWFGVGTTNSGITSTKYHSTYIMFHDASYNGNNMPTASTVSVCYYRSLNETNILPIPDDDTINKYTTLFGNEFIEFYNFDQTCFRRVGYHPYIFYNLSDDYFKTDSNVYYYEIWHIGENITEKTPSFSGRISFNEESQMAYYELVGTFEETGEYYILLYNTSDYGSVIDELIMYSQGHFEVCDVTDSGITPTDVFGIPVDDIPLLFKIIISLFIIIVLTITPYAFALLLSKGRIQVQMPSLVYVAFFFIGVVASIMLGFLDTWVIVIILIGLIITFAILWLQGKNAQGA